MAQSLVQPFARLRAGAFLRYFGTSVIALAADLGAFLALLSLASPAAAASAASYGLGILVHWLLSSRTVFQHELAQRGPARTRQKALFVGSALVGLALTTAIVALGAAASFDPRLAKLVAVAVSFAATWWLRRAVIFRTPSA